MSTWGNRSGWTTNGDWSAGSEQAKWEGSRGDWEQSGQQSRNPEYHRSPYRREAGNGNRPTANDPSVWKNGENKPTNAEYEQMLCGGPYGPGKPLRLKFKAYTQRECQKMGMEDVLSGLVTAAEREKTKKDAAAALHQAEMDHQQTAMAIANRNHFLEMSEMREHEGRTVEVEVEVIKEIIVEKEITVDRVIYVDRVAFVDVDVLPDGVDKPEPLFIGGQSIHQWWASWMAGAYEVPAGIKGKSGRPAWYSASVFSWEQFCLQACRDAGVPGVAICRE